MKRLAGLARREVKPANQRTVVPVVFRIGTVGGIPLAAPPAGNARPAIRIVQAVFSSDGHRDRPRHHAVGQRQIIAASLRDGGIRHHAHLVVGQDHHVRHQERRVGENGGQSHQVGGQRPAAKRVIDVCEPEIITVGRQLKVTEREIGPVVPGIIGRDGELDGNLCQVRVLGKRDVGVIRVDHGRRVFPLRAGICIVALIHHNHDVRGDTRTVNYIKVLRSAYHAGSENVHAVVINIHLVRDGVEITVNN